MPVRMPFACIAGGSRVYTNTPGLRGRKLVCCLCGVPVSWVEAYERDKDTDPVSVPAYFRLKRHHLHNPSCPFQVAKLIRAVAKGDTGGIFVVPPRESRGPVQVLLDAIRRSIKRLFNGENAVAKTMELARLHVDVSTAGEFEKNVSLVDEAGMVRWSSFYFERGRYKELYDAVERAPSHEVLAVVRGWVQRVSRVPYGSPDKAVINLSPSVSPKPRSGLKESVRLAIWSKDLHAFDSYGKGDDILAFGFWAIPPENGKGKSNDGYLNFELSFWPVFSIQVAVVHPIVNELLERIQGSDST